MDRIASWIAAGLDREERRDRVRPLGLLLMGTLLSLGGTAYGFETYSINKDATNCRECHGDFRASPYISLSDGQSWGDDLHDVHRNVMLDGDCETCHSAGGRFPVILGSSDGGAGLDPIACAGCHGRTEDGVGAGSIGFSAGLRQHHWNTGTQVCADCHDDAIPGAFTPVDEDILPPYYADMDAAHPNIPSDPCNPGGVGEDYAASTLGLDNDGDDLYDDLAPPDGDPICLPEPGELILLAAGIGFLAIVHRRRNRGRAL